MAKKFYIKERHNPQFKNPYYKGCGQLSKKEAKEQGNSSYGYNWMLAYDTEEEYKSALKFYEILKTLNPI